MDVVKDKVLAYRPAIFSEEQEKGLVRHIKKLEKMGFTPYSNDIKEIAYQLAEKLKISHRFPKNKKKAGDNWLCGFLVRNPELCAHKTDRKYHSRRTKCIDAQSFYEYLAKYYTYYNFLLDPGSIFVMDELTIGIMKNGLKSCDITPTEFGVIACCNAEGQFMPPVLIFIGTYSEDEQQQLVKELPLGSDVYVVKHASEFNDVRMDLFMKWFTKVFLSHKKTSKALLILDEDTSHSNHVNLLEELNRNIVKLICLPHSNELQPLDKPFFKPLKEYYYEEVESLTAINKNIEMTALDATKLIAKAWTKAATVTTGISVFRSSGIVPFNPSALEMNDIKEQDRDSYNWLMNCPKLGEQSPENFATRAIKIEEGCDAEGNVVPEYSGKLEKPDKEHVNNLKRKLCFEGEAVEPIGNKKPKIQSKLIKSNGKKYVVTVECIAGDSGSSDEDMGNIIFGK